MVKTYKNLLLQNQLTDALETWYVALDTLDFQVCSNDELVFTLTCFQDRDQLCGNV